MTWHNQVVQLAQSFQAFGSIVGGAIVNAMKPFIRVLNAGMQAAISFAKVVSDALGFIFGWKYEEGGGGVSELPEVFDDAAGGAGGMADGTGKAADNAKKLKSYLMGIDELNVLEPPKDDSGSGGGGGGGGGGGADGAGASDGGQWVKADSSLKDYLSDLQTLRDLGKWIGDTWSDALKSIPWEEFQKKAYDFGNGIAQFLNGLLVDSDLIPTIGTTIAEGLDTIVKAFQGFGENFEWEGFGKRIGQGINNFFANFDFKNYAHTINVWLNGILDMMIAGVDTVDWDMVGRQIGTYLEELDFTGIGSKIITLLEKAIKAALRAWKASFNMAPLETAIITGVALLKFTPVGAIIKKKIMESISLAFTSGGWSGMLMVDFSSLVAFSPESVAVLGGQFIDALWGYIGILVPQKLSDLIGNIGAGLVLGAAVGMWAGPAGALAGGLIGAFVGAIATAVQNIGGIKAFIDEMFKFPISADMFDKVKEMPDKFLEAVKSQDWLGAGRAIIEGTLNFVALPGSIIIEPIARLFTSIFNAFKEAFGIASPAKKMLPIGEDILRGVLKGIVDTFTEIPGNAKSFAEAVITNIKQFFGELKDRLLETGKGVVDGLIQGITDNFGLTENPVVTWAKSIFTWFTGDGSGDDKVNEGAFCNIARKIIPGFGSGITDGQSQSQSPVEGWANNIIQWFTKGDADGGINGTTWTNFAQKVSSGFGTGITTHSGESQTGIETWASNIKTWFWGSAEQGPGTGLAKAFMDFGKWMIQGFIDGARSLKDQFSTLISGLSEDAQRITEAKNKIASPSKVYYAYGEFIVEGFANGIKDNASQFQDAVSGMSSGAQDGMKSAAKQFGNASITTEAAQNGILGALSATVSQQNVAAATQAIPSGVKNSWDSTRVQWSHDMDHWWMYNVEPYFAYGRWQETTSTIQTSVVFNLNAMIEEWKKRISNWWDTQVAEYFRRDRWDEQTKTIFDSIIASEDTTVTEWSNKILNWWNTQVAPYFALDRWNTITVNITTSIVSAFDNAAEESMDILDDFFSEVESRIDDLRESLRSLREASSHMDFDMDGDIDLDVDVDWEEDLDEDRWDSDFSDSGPGVGFAGGGMPRSGQVFVARENGLPEMVGKFGNTTGVANNMQIVEGIASGVSSAMSGLVSAIQSLAMNANMPTYSGYHYGGGAYGAVGMTDSERNAYAQQMAQAIVMAQNNGDDNRLMRQQNELLEEILAKDSNVYLDGKSVNQQTDQARRRSGFNFRVSTT